MLRIHPYAENVIELYNAGFTAGEIQTKVRKLATEEWPLDIRTIQSIIRAGGNHKLHSVSRATASVRKTHDSLIRKFG